MRPDYSNKISKVHKRVVKDNKPFLQYDRHTIKNRYEDGGQRNEAIRIKVLFSDSLNGRPYFQKSCQK